MESYVRKPNCNCKECGKEIYRRPFQIKKGDVFCSTKCSNARNTKSHPCPVCGIEVKGRQNSVHCSRACSNKSRTGIQYNVGRPKDKTTKNRRLKNELLKTREPKCERCPFDFVEILHVHHIVERKNGGTDDINNLELLCPNCHYTHHYLTNTSMRD